MTDRLSRADLDRIARLHAESTPGEWVACHEFNVSTHEGRGIAACGGYQNNKDTDRIDRESRANREFIAAAHDAVPRLIADLLYWRRRWAEVFMDRHMRTGWHGILSYEAEEAREILSEEKE